MKSSLQWLCWQPTHYNDFLFRSLASDPEIDLTVHFREQVLASHPWQSELASGFRSRLYQRRMGLDWKLLRLAIQDKRSFFIIGGWNEPTIVLLINLLSARRRPFALWTDTPRVQPRQNLFFATLRRVWLSRIFQHATKVMGTGRVALAALSQLGCPEKKLVNFPFFVDLEHFSPRAAADQTGNGNLTFLSSGRLVNSLKGYDQALTALAYARDRLAGKGGNFKYRIAGAGPDKQTLSSLVSQLGLSGQVEFVGWLEPHLLPDFYRSGQVLLHPAHYDPFPNAILEAMACGLTVIGSDAAGSVVERIVHGHNGLIHRAGDGLDLAEKIADVLENPQKVAQMGEKARATAAAWPVSLGIDLVKELLQRGCQTSKKPAFH